MCSKTTPQKELTSEHPETNEFDPHAYYEKIKRENFRASSQLDGIEMSEVPSGKTLDDVVKKYQKKESE